MAQHKADMEKTMQSAFRHKRAGTEVATAVLGIEAMIESGIDTNEIAENGDAKVLQRCRAAISHKAFGKRLADSITTLDQIIADEGLTIEAEDKDISGEDAHKQGLRRQSIVTVAENILGKSVADTVDKAEKVVDELLVIYGSGGAKEDAPTEANLLVIKVAMQA